MRWFAYIAYNGENYHGWQVQPNGVSVQEELNRALSTVLRSDVEVVGAGRTDAGVHASEMVVHFDSEAIDDKESLVHHLNSILPPDIAVKEMRRVKDEAHARFSATARRYEYHVCTRKDPFVEKTAWRVADSVDFAAMNVAAKRLFEYTDFTSFSKLHTDVKTNNCKIVAAEWRERGDEWVFTIEADRFLRNMVRAIVGTLMEVGKHRIDAEEFCKIIEKKDRCAAATSAPAKGLFLVKVAYPEDIFID